MSFLWEWYNDEQFADLIVLGIYLAAVSVFVIVGTYIAKWIRGMKRTNKGLAHHRAEALKGIVGGSYAFRYALALDEYAGRVTIDSDGSIHATKDFNVERKIDEQTKKGV